MVRELDGEWRTDAAAWWHSQAWREYERAYGDEPGTRARVLAQAAWLTRILDLSSSEADLWAGLRKSYKALINRANRRLEFRLITNTESARFLHLLAADRVTRPLATWHLMADWLVSDAGVLVLGYDGAPLAFAYFIRHKQWAYYGSGASLEDDIQHAVIWHALLELKTRGVRWAELGWQGEATDAKGQSIEFLKRGFGGRDEPAALTEMSR